jgi:hypothetical protein
MSVSLNKLTMPDPYHIGVQVYGVASDGAGNAYVLSTTGTQRTTTLRKYNANGNYLSTVYPFPGNLSANDVREYGINDWETGGWYSPRATASASLNYSSTLVGSGSCWMMARPFNGDQLVLFAIGGWPTNYFTTQKIMTSGAMVDQTSMTLSPALPVARETGGEAFLCPAPGKDYIYLSGIYAQVNNAAAVDAAFPLGDTAFYHEGQVFKVNLATGDVDSFVTLPNVPYDTAARHAAFGDHTPCALRCGAWPRTTPAMSLSATGPTSVSRCTTPLRTSWAPFLSRTQNAWP